MFIVFTSLFICFNFVEPEFGSLFLQERRLDVLMAFLKFAFSSAPAAASRGVALRVPSCPGYCPGRDITFFNFVLGTASCRSNALLKKITGAPLDPERTRHLAAVGFQPVVASVAADRKTHEVVIVLMGCSCRNGSESGGTPVCSPS